MRPIQTDETIGIYGAPKGLEDVVSGLPYWREMDPDTGGPLIRSVWALDADEKEAIALGGNVLLGIVGEPIPPVQLAVLSPIDVPAFGMPALDPLQLPETEQVPGGFEAARAWYDEANAERRAWLGVAVLLTIAALLLLVGFGLGRLTG